MFYFLFVPGSHLKQRMKILLCLFLYNVVMSSSYTLVSFEKGESSVVEFYEFISSTSIHYYILSLAKLYFRKMVKDKYDETWAFGRMPFDRHINIFKEISVLTFYFHVQMVFGEAFGLHMISRCIMWDLVCCSYAAHFKSWATMKWQNIIILICICRSLKDL